MRRDEFAARLVNACDEVLAAEAELTEIDSRFGDADHGLTMRKVANAIKDAVEQADGGIQEMLDDAAMAVMVLNGGSAVPLWNTWLDGMQEAAPDGEEISATDFKAMVANALSELSDMSGAEVGDKTMMDAVIPASEAVATAEGDVAELIAAGAEAADAGAENSKRFASKFGRARSYGDKTIGTPDAGAVSMARFWRGLARFQESA
ncbi:MAG: DAK2 domain-containing protein [Collinsella sp.]|nr:DAK2 domain-containing protein [Collinsella sp.]